MGNKDTVKHSHTVPAAYLANFGIDGNKSRDSMFYFYNVQENKTDTEKVGNIPVINHFYDINELGEQKQIIEKFFGNKIEGELATLLRVLLGTIIIDPQRRDCSSLQIEKEQLSAQFALLITRTEAFRDYYKDIYQQIKDGFPYADIPQYLKTDFQRIHTSEILDFGMSNFYANLFSDWHWVFIINHTELPFITSDNPVIRIDHSKKTNKPISAVSPEVTYFVPLSPTVAVEIFHKDILKNDLAFFDIYQIKNIASYNKEIIKNCSRFLFSNKSFEALKCARDKINDET